MPVAKHRKPRQLVAKPKPMSARKKVLLAGVGIAAAPATGYLIYQKVTRK